jgi:Family of unknown function (DUF6328)
MIAFRRLDAAHQYLHFSAIVLIAISIGLIMAPAAYHRQVEPGSVSHFFVELASGLMPLMVSICIEVYIVGHLVLANDVVSMLIAGALLAGFVFGWFVFPNLARSRGRGS